MGNDEVLRVGANTPVASLASTISRRIYDSRPVTLRAIGAGPVSQAVKAVAVARGHVAAKGMDIGIVPGFASINMPDGVITGITLRVVVLPDSGPGRVS